MHLPNPRCVGGVTDGPPDSIQRKLSRPPVVRDDAGCVGDRIDLD